jgi:hypothetical protein
VVMHMKRSMKCAWGGVKPCLISVVWFDLFFKISLHLFMLLIDFYFLTQF